ncbi:unnamed protein product [Effrenium voratum]|nr:unnamed protein product [Effrenium voratum]
MTRVEARQLELMENRGERRFGGSSREAPEPLGKFSGSSVALILAAAVVARNVAMYGASPKGKRAHWRTQRDKVRWYRRGENAAKRALALGRGIRDGTVDFIYGQVEEQEDDDDYDDEYDDDDDDDELEDRPIS